ncbi:hypothetical protein [Prevotella fusca]
MRGNIYQTAQLNMYKLPVLVLPTRLFQSYRESSITCKTSHTEDAQAVRPYI